MRPTIDNCSLRIAWLGASPGDGGGVPGVARELLLGLTALGHRIDCYIPGAAYQPPAELADNERLEFVWGTGDWKWDRWYSRTRIGAFVSGLVARALASLRLRREIAARHARQPYDLLYQFSNIESLAVPPRAARAVPLVIHPETHAAGELRFMLAERRLALRAQPRHTFALVSAIMLLRSLVQRVQIRRAALLVCISGVFRDHLVRDYGFPCAATVVVPNPVRVERFAAGSDAAAHEPDAGSRESDAAAHEPDATAHEPRTPNRRLGTPPTVLVLGRVAVRKGVDDVVAVAWRLRERETDARIRVVGGPSLWSDYTPLLRDLPPENAEYAGGVPAEEIPSELAGSDLLLQASRYEPFALTVAEALAAGLPVVATSEVGAIEGVDRAVVAEVAPGDVEGMARAIETMLARLAADPHGVRAAARAEAERLFAPEVVCAQLSRALQKLVGVYARDVLSPSARTNQSTADANQLSPHTNQSTADANQPSPHTNQSTTGPNQFAADANPGYTPAR